MAKSAAEKAEIPVSVIDSKGPTKTLGWQVLVAAHARDEDTSLAAIIDRVAKVRESLVQVVALETMDYL